jgi:hypothetical protein
MFNSSDWFTVILGYIVFTPKLIRITPDESQGFFIAR